MEARSCEKRQCQPFHITLLDILLSLMTAGVFVIYLIRRDLKTRVTVTEYRDRDTKEKLGTEAICPECGEPMPKSPWPAAPKKKRRFLNLITLGIWSIWDRKNRRKGFYRCPACGFYIPGRRLK